MSKAIDYNQSYSLDDYDTWNELEYFIEDTELVNNLTEKSIKLADYFNATIKLPNNNEVQAILLWKNDNIIIVSDNVTDEELQEYAKYKIIAFRKSNIDFEKIKEIIKENG